MFIQNALYQTGRPFKVLIGDLCGLANLGFHISDTTVGNILKAHGIEPAPERESRTAWRTFLAAHWDSIAAADFTTVEVWTRSGLVTFYVLVVMHLKTRRIEIAGATPHPNSEWMQQVGRKPDRLCRRLFPQLDPRHP